MTTLEQLFIAALEVRQKAYAPYSKFAVGAALKGTNGKIYTGCNVENVSFPCGTCAEAGAVASMNADACRLIKEIVIVADSQTLITPCGACLQRLAEFSDSKTKIHLANLKGVQKSCTLTELLPMSFAEKGLKK